MYGRVKSRRCWFRFTGWKIGRESQARPERKATARDLIIWKAHLFSSLYYGRPGEVVRGPAGETMVISGDDRALVIDEMQIDDGPIETGRESLRPRTILGASAD